MVFGRTPNQHNIEMQLNSKLSDGSAQSGLDGDNNSNDDNDTDANRWTQLVRRRTVRLADLRREFAGWHGSHERHCILHDVLFN